jgi:2-polyprenyl-3-methyl-5-hydroxy-6-metoxy-1,4-benzoquinol methylase
MGDYADAEYGAGGLYRDYVDARDMKLAHFSERLRLMRPHVTPGRLLDVGCACGYFLEVAERDGFDVRGVESSQNAIAAASPQIRPKITHASLDVVAAEEDGGYDAITAFDVLEHLERPLEFLAQARRILRPGGHLAISTPDADHWLRPLMGARWPMLQPMQHLTIFSRKSLRLALDTTGFADIVVQPTHKVVSYEYLIHQVRSLNPAIFAMLTATMRVVPGGVMRHYRKVNIGEVLAIATRVD